MISIIIPCYNAAGTIAATVESALSQTGVETEVLVIDDGSTDNSLEIIRRFEPRLRVLTGPNRGVSAARNRGIEETRGEWVQFLDSDDLLVPGTLAQRLAAADDLDVVICDWQDFSEKNGARSIIRDRSVDRALVGADAQIAFATDAWAPPVAVLYRRALVEKTGGFRADLPVIQDARFLFDAARLGGRFGFSPHIGGYYRVLEESLSRRSPARFWRDIFLNARQIDALWRSNGALSTARRDALAHMFRTCAHGLLSAGAPEAAEALAICQTLGPVSPRLALAIRAAVLIGPMTAPALLARFSR